MQRPINNHPERIKESLVIRYNTAHHTSNVAESCESLPRCASRELRPASAECSVCSTSNPCVGTMLRRAVSLASRMGSGAVHQGVPTRAVASTGAKAVVGATAGAWSDTGSHHAWATVAAALGACAVVGAGVAACEHGLSPLEKAVVAGDASTGEGAVDAAATDLVSDSLEADVLDEKRERYKKHMKTPLLLISGTAHKELAGQIGAPAHLWSSVLSTRVLTRCASCVLACVCVCVRAAAPCAGLQPRSCMKCWWRHPSDASQTAKCRSS